MKEAKHERRRSLARDVETPGRGDHHVLERALGGNDDGDDRVEVAAADTPYTRANA